MAGSDTDERAPGSLRGDGATASAAVAAGALETPADGALIEGEVLEVGGWCLFEGSRTARVEVIVDGRSVGLARTHCARADIAARSDHPDAPVAGFHLRTRIEPRERTAESRVTVEAQSLDGRRWRSRTHRLSWIVRPPADDAERAELLAQESAAIVEQLPTRRSDVVIFVPTLAGGSEAPRLAQLVGELTAGAARDFTVIAAEDGPLRAVLEGLGARVHVTSPCLLDDLDAYEGRIHELALLMRAANAGAVLAEGLEVFPALEAAARAGVPAVWSIHDGVGPEVYRHERHGERGMHPHVVARFDAAFAAAAALVFRSRPAADLYAHLCDPDRVFVLAPEVALEQLAERRRSLDRTALRAAAGIGESDTALVVVGELCEERAQAALVAACDELASVHRGLRLILAGARPSVYTEALEAQVSRCAARDRVQVVADDPESPRWYAAADILVHAGDSEALPRSLLEGIAHELPVVCTDALGAVELIDDGWSGWLTRAGDLEGMVGLLHVVLRLPVEARRAAAERAHARLRERRHEYSCGRRLGLALEALIDDPLRDLSDVIAEAHAKELVR